MHQTYFFGLGRTKKPVYNSCNMLIISCNISQGCDLMQIRDIEQLAENGNRVPYGCDLMQIRDIEQQIAAQLYAVASCDLMQIRDIEQRTL